MGNGSPVTSVLRLRLLLGTAALLTAGCARIGIGGGSEGDAAELYRLPSFLPDGFALQATTGCVIGDRVEPSGTLVLFDDDGRRQDGDRRANATIRLGLWDRRQSVPDSGAPLSIDDLVADAEPGTSFDTDVDGLEAVGFAVAASAPDDSRSWPALVWTDGDLVLWLYGEGITELELVVVAESMAVVSRERFDQVVPAEEPCDQPLTVGSPAPATAASVSTLSTATAPTATAATVPRSATTTTAVVPPSLATSTGP